MWPGEDAANEYLLNAHINTARNTRYFPPFPNLHAVVAARSLPQGLKCTPISEHSTASSICSLKLSPVSSGPLGLAASNLAVRVWGMRHGEMRDSHTPVSMHATKQTGVHAEAHRRLSRAAILLTPPQPEPDPWWLLLPDDVPCSCTKGSHHLRRGASARGEHKLAVG
jgi:hypothetical protein